MTEDLKNAPAEPRQDRPRPLVSAVLADGTLVEMLHRPEDQRTLFAVFHQGEWLEQGELVIDGERVVPYAPTNNLLRHDVVLLPSRPEEYDSEEELLGRIRDFIHRYVDLSPLFETIAAYYVLLSWIYDSFNELPYLRVRGDPGCGKTRFLLTVGSLCYKPIFASGASTVSPLFRILDAFRGTLVLDESDFRFSDEKSEVVKILNNGNARGFPVLRSELTGKREYDPRAYAVFGPKLIGTRGFFDDRALESRCLTEELGLSALRDDVPINHPPEAKAEALSLRNQLLLFRFRSRGRHRPTENLVDRTIEPRLNQVFTPLLAVIDDPKSRAALRDLARRLNRQMIAERGMDMEAQLLEIIRDTLAASPSDPLTVKALASWFADRFQDDYDKKVTPKWIGSVLRKRLGLKPQKSHGVYTIPQAELGKLDRLYGKYGLAPGGPIEDALGVVEEVRLPDGSVSAAPSATDRVDLGDFGDVVGKVGEPPGELF